MSIEPTTPEDERTRTVNTLSTVDTLRNTIERRYGIEHVDRYSYKTAYCEINFRIEKVYTNSEKPVKKLKVSHLWIHPDIRGNEYGTTIKNAIEQVATDAKHVERIVFTVQVDSGHEPAMFNAWGYDVSDPYTSDYDNKVITAEKRLG